MKKAFLLVSILFVSVVSTACINNFAVQELNNKAKSYLEQGDFENAISRLKSSIDLDSTIFETHYNLGIAYTQAEKFPEAVETFKNAIKLRPNFADAYYSLAVAQENFAKGIIDGSLVMNEEKNEIQRTDKDLDAIAEEDRKLTEKEKEQIKYLFEQAMESYNLYLKKGKTINDKEEVEDKVIYLQNQLLKYS